MVKNDDLHVQMQKNNQNGSFFKKLGQSKVYNNSNL